MMKEISFKVQGSAVTPYDVLFVRRSETMISAYCSCPAGANGQYCKHRISILEGIEKGVVSENLGDIKTVQSWLPGTTVETAMRRMRELEAQEAKIKIALASAKKELTKAMHDS